MKTNTKATSSQGTADKGWDPNASATIIISTVPTAANPNNIEKTTEAELTKRLVGMSAQERIAYATKLKAAGYPVGPINGAVTKDLRKSWLNAHYDLQTEIQATKQQLDLDKFLAANTGTGGTGRAGTTYTTGQMNDTAAASLINTVFKDLTDQEATPEQIAKYTKTIRTAQAANPGKTTYDASGNVTTSGGIDAQELLTEQLKGTEEAKTKRATDAYTVMMEELGGLR